MSDERHSKERFGDKLKQSAEEARHPSAGRSGGGKVKKEKTPRTPAQKRAARKKAWFIVGTVLLVMVLTVLFFCLIFLHYFKTSMKGKEVDLSAYDLSVATEMYAKNTETDQWDMYQTLYIGENRIIITSDQIPEMMKQATIAIEDKRFESHKGVDWKGTLRAVVRTVTGSSVQGGSTITQQLIKNITGNNETTVKRKVTEIYRALQLEKHYDKDEILTTYLNTAYFGHSCNGVQTAARTFFGKDACDLTLAECASLISITNNPSMYDPLISEWTREQNRSRQTLVLEEMLSQGKIDQATYQQAMDEEVAFTNGYTIFGNLLDGYTPDTDTEDGEVEPEANNSYFTDQVISDVANQFVKLYSLTDSAPDADGNVTTAYERAVSMVYGGGYKIYTTQIPRYQAIAEDVFENTDYVGYTDSYDQPLQAAITVVDPFTGDVVALVGGTGKKTVDRGWNWATEVRQSGSAIKPISTYAPALDNGTITAASAIDDYPIELNGSVWPRNSSGSYSGLTTVYDALVWSLNTCAVRVNQMYGTYDSYLFMKDKLGFANLTETDGAQIGNMALGGLQRGVTTEEMAAAYAMFVNDGVYTKPRTFVRVEDSNGNVIIDNTSESRTAIKASTAYLMRSLLQSVVSSGTGSGAYFSGMSIGGKTGTTDDSRDRYFVGFTPYYSAAVWCGYKSNEVVYAGGNPCSVLWRQVMSRIHEDLADTGFHGATGVTTVTVCSDSGLLATEACAADLRGSRLRTVTVAADTAPTESCTVHKMVSYCTEGKHLATASCPASSVHQVAVLDYPRQIINGIKVADSDYLLSVISEGECPVHNGQTPAADPNQPGGKTDSDADDDDKDKPDSGGSSSGGGIKGVGTVVTPRG